MEFMTNLQDGLDQYKPSLFELLSEQQLSSLLPSTLRYLLVHATQRHPRYLLRVLNSFDELFALAMLVVERHFLMTYGGGFVENFYGLKRERILRSGSSGELPRTQAAAPEAVREALRLRSPDVARNLAIMVGLPYLKRKLDEGYERYVPRVQILRRGTGAEAAMASSRMDAQPLPPDASMRERIYYCYKWFLRKVYPSLNMVYHFSLLAFNLAYLSSATQVSSPLLWLLHCRMRRLGEADYRAIALSAQHSSIGSAAAGGQESRNRPFSFLFHPHLFLKTIFPKLISSIRILLPTSIFALKFLEWWHSSDLARQFSRTAAEDLQLPPPIVSGFTLPLKIFSPQASDLAPSNSKRTNTVSLASPPGASAAAMARGAPHSEVTQEQLHQSPMRRPLPPPVSASSRLPILTVAAPTSTNSKLCPICLDPIVNPTAVQTGYVFCYICIFKWIEGTHPRQAAWMEGGGGGEGWEDEEPEEGEDDDEQQRSDAAQSRVGRWENGEGRCPITGRRLLGGTGTLRRVIA